MDGSDKNVNVGLDYKFIENPKIWEYTLKLVDSPQCTATFTTPFLEGKEYFLDHQRSLHLPWYVPIPESSASGLSHSCSIYILVI